VHFGSTADVLDPLFRPPCFALRPALFHIGQRLSRAGPSALFFNAT
jgi:hypothetical protein